MMSERNGSLVSSLRRTCNASVGAGAPTAVAVLGSYGMPAFARTTSTFANVPIAISAAPATRQFTAETIPIPMRPAR